MYEFVVTFFSGTKIQTLQYIYRTQKPIIKLLLSIVSCAISEDNSNSMNQENLIHSACEHALSCDAFLHHLMIKFFFTEYF